MNLKEAIRNLKEALEVIEGSCVSMDEASKQIGVSIRTMKRWISEDTITHIRLRSKGEPMIYIPITVVREKREAM